MEKINSVYAVENKIGGGMKNIEKSKKEVNALHGDVSVYELNKPQPYEVFSSWPDDIQKEYLKKLYWTHGGSLKEIGDMLGVTLQRVASIFDELSLPKRPAHAHRTPEEKKTWSAFTRGVTLVKDVIPDETAQKLETFKNEKPVLMPAPPETKQVKTDTDADARQALLFAIEHLVHHDGAHVKIEITL